MHLIDSGGLVLAFVSGWKDEDQACRDEADANARLLAAAPDLLSIAMRLTALEGEWHPDRYQDEKVLLLKDARAALAKALGQ